MPFFNENHDERNGRFCSPDGLTTSVWIGGKEIVLPYPADRNGFSTKPLNPDAIPGDRRNEPPMEISGSRPKHIRQLGKSDAAKIFREARDRGMHPMNHKAFGNNLLEFTNAYVSHSISTASEETRELVADVFLNPKVQAHMFSSGTAREEAVRFIRNGIPIGRKIRWEECWHVTGKYVLDRRRVDYDFTVSGIKKNGKVVYSPYDLKIK